MSAVATIEQCAPPKTTLHAFFDRFDSFMETPEGVAKLRELILDLAVRGKLVEQDVSEGSGKDDVEELENLKWHHEAMKRRSKRGLTKSDFEWDVPANWGFTTLESTTRGDGLFCDGDWVESKDQDPSGSVRLTQLADVGDGEYRDRSQRFMTPEAAERLNCTYLKPNDVLLARMPDPLGRACIFPGDPRPCVTVVDVCIVRCNTQFFDPRFVVIAINCGLFREQVYAKATGTTRQRISRGNLASFPIPVPPLSEQRRIVAKVNDLTSLCDELESRRAERVRLRERASRSCLERLVTSRSRSDLRSAWRRLSDHFEVLYSTPETLAHLRQSILQLAVQGKLVPQDPNDEPADTLLARIQKARAKVTKNGPRKTLSPIGPDDVPHQLPDGWRWVRLQDTCCFENGDRSKNYPSGADIKRSGVPFISTKAIIDYHVCLDGVDFITAEKFASLRSGKLMDQDILVVLRGSVGKLGMFQATEEFTTGFINAQLVIVRNSLPELAPFTLEYFKSPVFQRLALARSSGSAQPQLSATELSQTLLPLPPLGEQKRIVAKVHQLLSNCDDLSESLALRHSATERLLFATTHHLLDFVSR